MAAGNNSHIGDLTTSISVEIQVTPGYILYKISGGPEKQ